MFERLLVTTDLTPASENLLRCLGPLRKVGAAEVTLIHVVDIRDVGGLYLSLLDVLRPRMAQLESILLNEGYLTRVETPTGNPAREIRRFSEKDDFSAIVVGTHGGSLAKDVLLGSVAHSILESVRKPVLLIPFNILAECEEERCQALCGDPFRHVLFATDFSDTAEKAFTYLRNIVQSTHPEITLYHIQDTPSADPHAVGKLDGEHHDSDLERLGRMEKELVVLGASRVHIEITSGRPARRIVERANSGAFSLLMMGNQGHGYWVETLLGREAHYVVKHVDIPLLLVPLTDR